MTTLRQLCGKHGIPWEQPAGKIVDALMEGNMTMTSEEHDLVLLAKDQYVQYKNLIRIREGLDEDVVEALPPSRMFQEGFCSLHDYIVYRTDFSCWRVPMVVQTGQYHTHARNARVVRKAQRRRRKQRAEREDRVRSAVVKQLEAARQAAAAAIHRPTSTWDEYIAQTSTPLLNKLKSMKPDPSNGALTEHTWKTMVNKFVSEQATSFSESFSKSLRGKPGALDDLFKFTERMHKRAETESKNAVAAAHSLERPYKAARSAAVGSTGLEYTLAQCLTLMKEAPVAVAAPTLAQRLDEVVITSERLRGEASVARRRLLQAMARAEGLSVLVHALSLVYVSARTKLSQNQRLRMAAPPVTAKTAADELVKALHKSQLKSEWMETYNATIRAVDDSAAASNHAERLSIITQTRDLIASASARSTGHEGKTSMAQAASFDPNWTAVSKQHDLYHALTAAMNYKPDRVECQLLCDKAAAVCREQGNKINPVTQAALVGLVRSQGTFKLRWYWQTAPTLMGVR